MEALIVACLGIFLLSCTHVRVYAAKNEEVNKHCLSDECKTEPDFEKGKDDCGLVGKWKNELSSQMVITNCTDGQINGLYNSQVGRAQLWYILTGRYTITDDKNKKPTAVEVGWTVSWNNKALGNSNSVTTWSGIYYTATKTIHTQWILTRYQTPDNLWQSAMVNHDTFIPM